MPVAPMPLAAPVTMTLPLSVMAGLQAARGWRG